MASQNKFTTNNNPLLAAVSNADGETPVYLYADPSTHALVTSGGGGGGGSGTEYTDGAVSPTHPAGGTVVFNNAGTMTAVSDTNPLPTSATVSTTGLATSAKQDTGNTSLASIDGKITAVNTGAVVVSSSALPSGAATSAKQPALGTAGTASADVLTVQGKSGMTALVVDGSGVTQPVSGTFWQATQPVSGTITVQQSTASSLKIDLSGTAANTTAIKVDGSAVTQPVSLATNTPTLQAGSAIVGKVGIDQTTPGTTNAVVDTPVTSGGLSIVTGSVGATATAIKASAGQLYGYHLFNTTAAVAYVQIFNVAAASVTLGTTAPTFSIGIPASGGVTVNFDKGIAFGTAISFACTTTRTGSTGATCDVNFFYK